MNHVGVHPPAYLVLFYCSIPPSSTRVAMNRGSDARRQGAIRRLHIDRRASTLPVRSHIQPAGATSRSRKASPLTHA